MKKRLYHHICGMLLPCFAFAAVTGAVSAVLVTAFKLLAELGISLSAFGDAFSVGARMFFVDFGGDGECGEILVSSVGASRGGTVLCDLGVTGACCVVITPIAYVGRRRIEGEKRVAIINVRDGEVWVILT